MHIVGVILADIAVTVIGQSQLVVLGTIQNTGLQGGIHIAEAHGGGGAAQQTHHFHVGGRLLHADLQALQVGGLVDGGLDGVEIAGACVQPGHRLQTGLGGSLEDGVRHLGVVHGLVVGLHAGEQVRQVEDLVFGAEGLHDGSGRHHKIDSTGLGQLHHFGLGAQQLTGVHLHAVLVAQLFIDVVGKRFQAQVIRVGLGLHMADAHDLAVVIGAGAAAGKHRAACQCRCAHQRQKRSSFHELHPLFSLFRILSCFYFNKL